MKKRVFVFLGVALLALAIVPLINLSTWNGPKKEGQEWWSDSVLYNFDFASALVGRVFYPHGISTNPTQVFIGKDDWLYLGEQYEKTVTARRNQPTVQDAELARIITGATTSWDQWLNLKGVSMFRVMLGPDKNTVYPEFLPDWAQQASMSTTDSLLANDSKGLYVDTRGALRTAKSRFSESLYYKTDTHWNSLGAWVAFRAFEAEIARSEPGLHLLSDNHIRISKVNERQGGDLAKFLRMKETLRDSEVVVDILSEHPIEIEQYEFDTGRLKKAGGNPQIHTARQPLLVKSKHALNDKKVLWLRDSFGTAMAPFMAATFSETLQIHYETADTALLARLVETFKPDYVFVTVVERAARRKRFGSVPPLITASKKPSDFTPLSHGMPAGTHDLVKARNSDAYQVSGADPYVTFSLDHPVHARDASQLVLDLNCGEKTGPVQVQVSWHAAGRPFSEANSIRFAARPGTTAINLSPLASWAQAGAVTDIRVDIDSVNACPIVAINSLELGKDSRGESAI
jgi:alginate O-acetyltransferase complex protein AlgJ